MCRCVVGVDLGGTQIRAALANNALQLIQQARQPTCAGEGMQAVLRRIRQIVAELASGASRAEVMGIGIASPGPLDPCRGVVIAPPNLPGWQSVTLRDIMLERFRALVFVNKDASLAGLAEHRLGAGYGTSDMVYATISSGRGDRL